MPSSPEPRPQVLTGGRGRSWRRPARAAAVVVVLAGVLAGSGVASAASTAPTAPATGFLVVTRDGQAAAVADRLRRSGTTVTREMAAVGLLSVQATPDQLRQLRADPGVTGVTGDSSVVLQADSWSATANAGSLLNVTKEVGARSAWAGGTGQGVDVALIDSGVSPVPGLSAGQVVQGPDLSFDSQVPALRSLDGFGHGTHMAGIIAGRDASFTGAGDTTSFAGVAPGARVVSVKVADAYGNADVSQIIAGIDWVVQNRRSHGLNIRVLNLSVGLPSSNGYRTDPLAHAAEQAWQQGIVVVASAGNNAREDGQLLSPAYDPYVVAVGASDSRGTTTPYDDVVPEFSSRGTLTRSPDVIAPGRSVASLRVPGSYLDQQYPDAAIGGRFMRGSGTSQSAAVVSGSVALLLQRRPSLMPDQVKEALRGSAQMLFTTTTLSQGKGKLRVAEALSLSTVSRAQGFSRSTGTGSLDAARGGYRVESGGVALTGERDVFGRALSTSAHAGLAAAGTAWSGGRWNGAVLTGEGFSAAGWQGATWAGTDWAGRGWTAERASPGTSWDGRSWNGGHWAGRSWNGSSWAGKSWATSLWR